VLEHNIEMIPGKSISECARLCNQRSDCKAFEYGVNYGGGGYGRERDCHLQSSSDPVGCKGAYYNFDLYVKKSAVERWDYRKIDGGCVKKSNLELTHDSTPEECSLRCDASRKCMAFEFGRNYGGSGRRRLGRPNDCNLQSGTNKDGCNGREFNFDLYLRLRKKPQIPSFDVRGEWVSVYPPMRTYPVGSSRTDGQALTTSFMAGMEASASAGFDSGKSSFIMDLTAEMSTAITKKRTQSDPLSFEPKGENDSLWQWVFDYYQDFSKKATTMTLEFAMTPSRAMPPRCIPGRCRPGNPFEGCQRCIGWNTTIDYR